MNRRELLRWGVRLIEAGVAIGVSGCGDSTPVRPAPAPPLHGQENHGQEHKKFIPRPTFPPETRIAPKERLAAVMHEPIDVDDPIRKAIESVTNAYSGSKRPDNKVQRLRQLAFSETTTDQIILRAQNGNLIIVPEHPAVVVECDQLEDWAKQPKETREGMFDIYAEGIIDGLSGVFSREQQVVVGIEAGHWSSAPKDKIDKINRDRATRGVKPPIKPTRDTGAIFQLQDQQGVVTETFFEKDANLAVSRLVALKIMERFPSWIPVLNTQEAGFPVDRFIDRDRVPDTEEFYITNRDSIISLRYKWEELARRLRQLDVLMVRVSIHFDGTPRYPGGFTMPQNAKHVHASSHLAMKLSEGMERRVRPYVRYTYTHRPRPDRNDDPNSPFWMIDDLAPTPEDIAAIKEGRVERWNPDPRNPYNGIPTNTNQLLAQIRREYLQGNRR